MITINLDSLLIILLTIKNNKGKNSLYRSQLTYVEIGELCNYALENGLIIKKYEKFELTEKGIQQIDRINKDLGRKGINKFIAPFSKYTIEKKSKEDIYIPLNFM